MNALTTPETGHNNPPSTLIIAAEEAIDGIKSYLKNNETITNVPEANRYLDAAKDIIDELEEARDALVRPHNTIVKNINSEFRSVRDPLEKLRDELKARLIKAEGTTAKASETLQITDAQKLFTAILKERNGILTEKLADALKMASRDYRKLKGELPPGIVVVQ
jgi:hypothetical protein